MGCFVAVFFRAVFMKTLKTFKATITIDAREHSLIQVFHKNGASGHSVRLLPVGDVQCVYTNGTGWLLERKSAQDFEASR